MTHPTIFDQIERDREDGTPGPWYVDHERSNWLLGTDHDDPEFPYAVAIFGTYAGINGSHDRPNIRRASRVPDLEAIALASQAMADAWDPSDGRYEGLGHWMAAALDDSGVCAEMKADITRMFEAFAAYRAAVAEIQSRPDQSGRG